MGYIDDTGSLVCPSMTRGAWQRCKVEGKDIVFPPSSWGGLWGRSLIERRSLLANDALQPPDGHLPLSCALAVPVLDGDELLGQLAVANRAAGYSKPERELLEAVAERIAPILKARNRRIEADRHRAELADRLREAEKLEAVGLLAGGIAHDFNNILQGIYGHAEFLLLTEASHRSRQHLERICEGSERAAGLVRQLLAFGRKQVLQTVRIDLNELVGGLVPLLAERVGESIRIEMVAGAGLPPVELDRVQIEEAVSELVNNAAEAMPDGGTITLRTACSELDAAAREQHDLPVDGQLVEIVVQDTGAGMDARSLAHVFEPFFTTKQVGEGPGLGLATVYGIVRQHGGAVVASSTPGLGSEFVIHLPTQRPEPAAE
jgi:signal transduction histidine kinase